jgi:methylmalonyl-CoA mutase
LLGSNHYPDFNETISPEADIGKIFSSPVVESENLITPVRLFRGSEEYEKLRISADNALKRPVAFMLPFGNYALSQGRSRFSANFFACGGYKIIDNKSFNNIDEGIKAALDAHADIVVICSSDKDYAALAPLVFDKIQNKAIVVVAGNPECKDQLISKGIKYFISPHTDVPGTLKLFNNKLGIDL